MSSAFQHLHSVSLNADDAQQLLGTLSNKPGDIQAAYQHQYRNCALELARVDTQAEQQQLEQRLTRLRQAKAVLLHEPGALHQEPGTLPQTLISTSGHQHDTNTSPIHRSLKVLISSTLVIAVCAVVALGSLLINQKQQLSHLQQQLTEQSLHQHLLQETLSQNLLRQEQAHQQWLTALDQQQQLLQRQHQQITQQQQQLSQQQTLNTQLNQKIGEVRQRLASEQQQSLALQQQVARLNQQSGVLISELCQDSAEVFPQPETSMMPAYMNRCRLLWSLASE